MAGIGQGIGSKMMGELGGVVKDVGKGVAEVPKQIVDGTNQTTGLATSSGQSESASSLERNVGGSTQQTGQNQQNKYGWGASLSNQFGLKQAQSQQRLAQVRGSLRDIEQELARVRQGNQQQEQQKQQIVLQEKQQKQEITRAKEQEGRKPGLIKRMLSLGKGERKVKGK